MSGRARLVVAVLIGTLLGAVPVPATAVPAALGLDLIPTGYGLPVDQPFLDEEFFAQSDHIPGVSGSTEWVCHVDFGDGTTGGYWRAKAYDSSAPCAALHAYSTPGTYSLVMTVTDTEGNTASERRDVTVAPRPVATKAAGVEGASIELTGPQTATPPRWSLARQTDNDSCAIRRTPAATVKVDLPRRRDLPGQLRHRRGRDLRRVRRHLRQRCSATHHASHPGGGAPR